MIRMLSEIWSFILIAIALGLDGFSVCLSLGLQNLRLKRIFFIGLLIGIFHMVLPFIGFFIGHLLSLTWENIASLLGGSILVFLGLYMIYSTLLLDNRYSFNPFGVQLLSLAFIVSIDSFPVGLSLGLSGFKTTLLILLFGVSTTLLAWTGLLIGKKSSTIFGAYSEMVGGFILFLFGIIQIFEPIINV